MEFIEQFAWALPKAFRDAVATCSFQEGDMLYSSRRAYDDGVNWGMSQNMLIF